MDFGQLLGRAFQITIRHRALWLYGFLLALFGGAGGGVNFQLPSGNAPTVPTTPGAPGGTPAVPGLPPGLDPSFLFAQLGRVPTGVWIALAVIFVLALLFFGVLGTILRNVSRVALIGMVDQVETVGQTSVRSGWGVGWSRFAWRNFLMELLLGIVVFVIALLIAALFVGLGLATGVASQQSSGAGGAFGLLICLGVLCLLPLALIGSIIFTAVQSFASRFIVLREAGVIESLGEGWRLFRANWGNVVILLIILFIIGAVWGIILFIIALLTGGLLGAGVGFLTYALTQSSGAAIAAAIPGVVLTVLVMAVLNALFVVFYETLWTLLFRRLPNQGLAPATAIVPTPTM